MRPLAPSVLGLLVVALGSGDVRADPAADLQTAIGLRRNPAEARRLLESAAGAPGAPAALRAEAGLRRGCLAINDAEGGSLESATDVARDWFGRALRWDPKVRSPEDWNPRCEEVFAEARASARAVAPKPGPRPASTTARDDLERERRERLKLQERLEGLRREVGELKQGAGAADRVTALEQTIEALRSEVKARDDRILAMSLRPEPAPPREFERRLTAPTLVVGGLSVAALGAGIGFGVSALASKSAFDATPYQAEAARHAADGRRSQIVADACYGGALALAVTAVLVYVFQGPPEPGEGPP